MNKQDQKSGDESINIQANEVVVHQGLSYDQVKEISIDVFDANFYKLIGVAKEVVAERVEDITETFLRKLHKENPEGFKKAEDPDFQYALLTTQNQYARTGDKDLGDLLIDLLVDRSKQENRNIIHIVLNEALNTAPKLTTEQFSTLATIFLFRYSAKRNLGTLDALGQYFDEYISRFLPGLTKSDTCYRHLQYAACGSVQLVRVNLEKCVRVTYQGLFCKGFVAEEIEKEEIPVDIGRHFFIQCLNDDTKVQVNALDLRDLKLKFEQHAIQDSDKSKIIKLFENYSMNEKEVIEKCVSLRPYTEEIFDIWNNSDMGKFDLTSVGIAIGHANVKRFVGEYGNLETWIN